MLSLHIPDMLVTHYTYKLHFELAEKNVTLVHHQTFLLLFQTQTQSKLHIISSM